MFVIFGIKRRKKMLGRLNSQLDVCSICSAEKQSNIIRVRTWLALFFIPVIPFSSKYYVICSHCDNGYEIHKVKANELLSM